jgi:phosphatidylglycerophosphate synthase
VVSIREIRDSCQREKVARFEERSWLVSSYLVHRRISVPLTWLLLNALPGVRPNQVSGAMVALGLVGAFLLASPTTWIAICGVAVLYLSFLLDKVDGDIARYRGLYSRYGELLDQLYHLVPQPLVYLALGMHACLRLDSVAPLLLGFLAYAAAAVHQSTPRLLRVVAPGMEMPPYGAAAGTPQPRPLSHRVGGGLVFLMRFDVRLASFLLAILLEGILPTRTTSDPVTAVLLLHALAAAAKAFLTLRGAWRMIA